MLIALVAALSSVFKTRAASRHPRSPVGNLALRHQLGVLHRSVKKPKLTPLDRHLWAWLCGVWADWRSALIVVKPETVIAWHRKGFRLFWTWRVRHGQLYSGAASDQSRRHRTAQHRRPDPLPLEPSRLFARAPAVPPGRSPRSEHHA